MKSQSEFGRLRPEQLVLSLQAYGKFRCAYGYQKNVGIFVTVILNAGLGSVLGIFTATTSLWMICPYSWVPHLMISVLGILPNGEPVADQSTAMAFWMIILVLVISLAWFAALSFLTARWFEKKEVG